MADSDFLRILTGKAFRRRCRIKGLCLRSPARRLPRPLAPATVDVFAPTAIPQSLPLEGKVPPKGADEVSPRSGVKPPSPPQRAISRPGASAFFVSDGPISSNSGRNGGKNAGRNCVSALPQRATVGCDFPHLLAGITFHHRCRSKGLRVRSPARRLPRPLAPATVDVFAPTAIPQSLPLEGKVPPKGADEVSPRSGVSALFVSDGDSFAPGRENVSPTGHFCQQRQK